MTTAETLHAATTAAKTAADKLSRADTRLSELRRELAAAERRRDDLVLSHDEVTARTEIGDASPERQQASGEALAAAEHAVADLGRRLGALEALMPGLRVERQRAQQHMMTTRCQVSREAIDRAREQLRQHWRVLLTAHSKFLRMSEYADHPASGVHALLGSMDHDDPRGVYGIARSCGLSPTFGLIFDREPVSDTDLIDFVQEQTQ